MYKISILTIFALLVFLSGCSSKPNFQEPEGKPVTLTTEDLDRVSFSRDSMKMWAAWEGKGVRLALNRDYEEALFCFNQAVKEWPQKVEGEDSRIRHFPEPTDTLLQKGVLYLKMKRPALAIVYFKKFDSYLPKNKDVMEGMKKAEAMLKDK